MASQPNRQDRREADSLGLLEAVKSTGFWSAIGAIVGLVATAAGIILFLTVDELRNFAISVLIIGLVLLFVAMVLSPRAIAVFMAGRQGRYGANVAIMTIAFFVIVGLINFLLFLNPTRVDVTATRIFSLSQQTIQVLDNMEAPVRANAFFAQGGGSTTDTASERQQAEDLLNEFARRSSNFTYRFIDPELNRSVAVQYDVTDFPVIVFEDLETQAQQSVFQLTEQDFVTGILVATGVQQKRVYYLTGHQEAAETRDPLTGDVDDLGLDFALQGMQRDNYSVLPLNLKQEGEIPSDAAVVVVAGPKSDLDQEEAAAFTKYLLDGGKVVMLLDPDTPDSWRTLILPWGLQLGQDRLADIISNVAGEVTSPMVQRSNDQFVSSGLTGIPIADQLSVAFFPDATAVNTILPYEDMPPYMSYGPIARTTPASWLETHPEEVSFEPGDDNGPLPFDVGAVMQAGATLDGQPLTSSEQIAKLVVFGDSDFARNKYFYSNDNSNLLLNSVNWLAEDYELISIRIRLVPYRELVVNQRERDFIKWSSWFVPPALMLILGIFVWWRRR